MKAIQHNKNFAENNLERRLCNLQLLALDVDGVLTDGSLNISNDGEIFKSFNAKDGLGISIALRSGLQIAIITGRKSGIIHQRASELGIKILREGVHDKAAEFHNLLNELHLSNEEAAYMGDDLNDLPAFNVVGVSFAPCNAANEVIARADVVVDKKGGKGAVRSVIETILKAKGQWNEIVASYTFGGQGDKQ